MIENVELFTCHLSGEIYLYNQIINQDDLMPMGREGDCESLKQLSLSIG
jgi:hypothetical protein